MSDLPAREAGKRAARRLGLGAVEPVVVAMSNHVVLHLAPAPVVARVRRADGAEAVMRRELDIVRHLAARDAPVLAPLAEAGPLLEDGFVMTFWPLTPHRPANGDDALHQRLAADTLRRIHRAFADFPGALPGFAERLASCHALLVSAPLALAAEDRRFLLAVHDEIAAALQNSVLERVPIHGDSGFHNLLLTNEGPLWTDFESACLGPRDWDFAALEHEDVPLMSMARGFCVSVWCWAQADLPGKRESADYHLKRLYRVRARDTGL